MPEDPLLFHLELAHLGRLRRRLLRQSVALRLEPYRAFRLKLRVRLRPLFLLCEFREPPLLRFLLFGDKRLFRLDSLPVLRGVDVVRRRKL